MILAVLLCVPAQAQAQQVSGAERVAFVSGNAAATPLFGWWLPADGAPRPAVIAMHGCGGLYERGNLGVRHRAMAELLQRHGFHVLFPDSMTPRGLRQICTVPMAERSLRAADRRFDIHGALDWLAARPEVDRDRIVVLGWSHGGSALLSALAHRIGPMPLQARAAVAFYPGCTSYARSRSGYQPVAPLLILIGELDDWTPPQPCVALADYTAKVFVRVFPGSYHGFDHPGAPLRVRKDVPNGVRPGQGVTVGSNAKAREEAHAAMFEFLERELR